MHTQVADIILHETGVAHWVCIKLGPKCNCQKWWWALSYETTPIVSSTNREHYLGISDDLNGMGDTSNGDYCGGKYMITMVTAVMNSWEQNLHEQYITAYHSKVILF